MHGMTSEDRMYSVRVAPWHIEQGTNVLMLDSTPETRMDRMTAAGQNWTVEERDVFRKIERQIEPGVVNVTFPRIPEWKLLERSDTGSVLHVARGTYGVIQNVVGHELFEALAKDATLEDGTGGTIDGGKQCYLSARLDEPYSIPGDESPTYPYVVVTWSHDGSGALQARATDIRVVCWNTLSASEAQSERTGRRYTFRHTSKVTDRIEDAKRALAGVRNESNEVREVLTELAVLPVTEEQRELFVTTFVPEPVAQVVSDRVRGNIETARAKVRSLLTTSVTVPDAHRETAYGLLLAGTEYLDHLRGFRNTDTYLGRTLLREESLKAKLVPMIREIVAA